MIYPSADTIEDKVGSRYTLVVLAAKRAKQIKEGAPVLIDTASTNPLTIALEEIAAGKVTAQAIETAVTPSTSTEETTPVAASHLTEAARLLGAGLDDNDDDDDDLT